MAMTQEQMDRDMSDAAAYLGCTRLTVQRSRHESTTETALWIMDGDKQIGSASRLETPYERGWEIIRWRCATIHNGQAANGVYRASLLDCMGHIMRCTKESVS